MNDSNVKLYLTELIKANAKNPDKLSQLFLDMKALTPEFKKSLTSSVKLKNIIDSKRQVTYLVDDVNAEYVSTSTASIQMRNELDLSKHFSAKLDEAVKSENYEEAARIRDYMRNRGLIYLV